MTKTIQQADIQQKISAIIDEYVISHHGNAQCRCIKGAKGHLFVKMLGLFENELSQAHQSGIEQGRVFDSQEIEVMLLDYQSLISIGKQFPRTVVGDKNVEFLLDANDKIRENILKKLEALSSSKETRDKPKS